MKFICTPSYLIGKTKTLIAAINIIIVYYAI